LPINEEESRVLWTETGRPKIPVIDYFEDVLGAVYSRPIQIKQKEIDDQKDEVSGILDVAEYLGCVHFARGIHLKLLQQCDQALYRSIQQKPFKWGDLALRLCCPKITGECVVHLVGQWKHIPMEKKANMPCKLRELCERKLYELEELKAQTEHDIAAFVPLKVQRQEISNRTSRASYCNDVFEFIAISAWQMYLSESFVIGRGRMSADGGWGWYSQLWAGGDAYLTQEDMKAFHAHFAMSARATNTVYKNIGEIKEAIKTVIKPLMTNKSNLDRTENPVNYFTCTSVTDQDVARLWEEVVPLDWGTPDTLMIPETGRPLKRLADSDESNKAHKRSKHD